MQVDYIYIKIIINLIKLTLPLVGAGGVSFSYLSNSALSCSFSNGFSLSKNICNVGPIKRYKTPICAIAVVRTEGFTEARPFLPFSIRSFKFKLLQRRKLM